MVAWKRVNKIKRKRERPKVRKSQVNDKRRKRQANME